MKKCGFSVTVAYDVSNIEEWFDPTNPLYLIPIKPEVAKNFRKNNIKGFITPGANNLYLGAITGNLLFGVLGFSNPKYGTYDILLKADTTPSLWYKSTDLLLFALRSKECKHLLQTKFGRNIDTAYTMAFSKYPAISRYKKHGKLINKQEVTGGFNLGYIFNLGTIPSLKEAKAQFIQKSWKK